MTGQLLAAERTAPPTAARLLRASARLRRLLFAHLAGKLAQHLLVLAVGLHVLQETSSGAWASVVVALGYAPQALLSGPAGALADRHSRSAVLAWSTSVRGGAAAFALVATVQQWPLPALVAALGVASLAATPAFPAVAAGAPQCVPGEAAPVASSLVTGVENAGWTAGPGLLGVIVLAGGGPSAALAVATALLGAGSAAACLLGLPRPGGERAPARSGQLLPAARLVLRAPALRGPLALATVGNFLYGYLVVALVLLGSLPGAAPDTVGRLNAALAAGAVLPMLLVARLARLRRAGPVLCWSMALFAGCVLLLGVTRGPILAVLLVAGAGAGTVLVELVAVTQLQRGTPAAAQGRVFGIYDQLAGVAIALGSLAAGPLSVGVGPAAGTVLIGAVCLVLTAIARLGPAAARRPGRPLQVAPVVP